MAVLRSSLLPSVVLTLLVLTGRPYPDGGDALLLKKENGPWMVQARIFRGPSAATLARILAMELRDDYEFSAYIYRDDQKPFVEISVLVGNLKTEDDAKSLLNRVRRIVSKRLVGHVPLTLTTLKTAKVTANPCRN
jgi:hypothetical protein